MNAQTNIITITIKRTGHFYYYSRKWGDEYLKDQPISRERAETVIRAQSDGNLPAGVNLDVCHPRSWIWQKELIDD